METTRQIQGANGIVRTNGNYWAGLYSEQARLSYDLTKTHPVSVRPFIGVIGQQFNRASFTENTQTGFELHVNSSTYHSTRSQLGALVEVPTRTCIKPFVSVDWEHEFSDVNGTFDANLVGVNGQFPIQGQAVGRDAALVKAGAVVLSGQNWTVSALYQGWYGNSWQQNGGTLQASVMFG